MRLLRHLVEAHVISRLQRRWQSICDFHRELSCRCVVQEVCVADDLDATLGVERRRVRRIRSLSLLQGTAVEAGRGTCRRLRSMFGLSRLGRVRQVDLMCALV